MKHLRWSAAGFCIVALAACDSTPVDPGTAGGPPANGLAVTAPILGAVPVLSDVDGHLYDAVAEDGGITWTDARAAAEAMSSGSCQGYLASITTEAENNFILKEFQAVAPMIGIGYWIGGYQDPGTTPADAGWKWVSGEAFAFSPWVAGAPDDGGPLGDEDAIYFVSVSAGGFGGEIGWDDMNQSETAPGYVVEFDGACSEDEVMEVLFRLKRGHRARRINMRSRGRIAAAVLSSAAGGEGDGFDATTIDPTTVTLGDGSDPNAPVAGNRHGRPMAVWPDLNRDGLRDALFHFRTQDLVSAGLNENTTELVLRGMTTEGVEFYGTDEVRVRSQGNRYPK